MSQKTEHGFTCREMMEIENLIGVGLNDFEQASPIMATAAMHTVYMRRNTPDWPLDRSLDMPLEEISEVVESLGKAGNRQARRSKTS